MLAHRQAFCQQPGVTLKRNPPASEKTKKEQIHQIRIQYERASTSTQVPVQHKTNVINYLRYALSHSLKVSLVQRVNVYGCMCKMFLCMNT